jgi:hypothetical protein
MTLMSVLLSSAVLTSLLQPALAADNKHAAYLASVSIHLQACGFRRSRPRIPIGSRPPIPI